jgi:hypothetical protein
MGGKQKEKREEEKAEIKEKYISSKETKEKTAVYKIGNGKKNAEERNRGNNRV